MKISNNKWFFFFLLMGGSYMAGQAAHYFISGESYNSSSLRDILVIVQFILGGVIAFYGWKKFRLMNNSGS